MTKDEALRLALVEINRLCDTGKITGATIETIQAIKAALEAKDEPVQEPWESEMRNELVALGFDGQCPESIGITLKRWRDGYAAAERKPLTDEEIIDHFKASVDTGFLLSFVDGVRYAEAAHGIKGEK